MVFVLILLALFTGVAGAQPFDLILQGGRILDGSGNAWFRADVGIRGGRIAAVGKLAGASAKRTIQLKDEFVAPGFIDMMGASTIPLLLEPASAESKLRQGITTMFAGEGNSPAPQTEQTLPANVKAANLRWSTYAEYHKLLESRGLALNVIHNVGAAQIRRIVIGEENRPPTPAELEKMKALVVQAMKDGATGVSTALIYPPGTYASAAELTALVKASAPYSGFYSTHMRNESAGVLEAIKESIRIAEDAGVPLHIYHLKAAGESNWPLMAKAVDLIASTRNRGIDVSADIYPYIRNGLGISAFIPPHYFDHGAKAFLSTLNDPAVRAKVRREIETTSNWENWYQHVGRNWDNVLIAQIPSAADKALEGKSVAAIAKIWKRDEWDAFFDLVLKGASANPKSMNEEQKYLALRTPWVSICTDAAPADIATATGSHPRAFGSFPRVLSKYVRDERIIPVEEAIRKMTSLPANRLRLFDRGHIAPGMAADIVVFDLARVADNASFEKPLAFPQGLPYVIVNGGVVIDNGKFTPNKPGKVLRNQPETAR